MANSQIPQGSNGTIPVADAKEQVANWSEYLKGSDLTAKAFLFSMDTFNNLMKTNPGADGIRVYLALKTAGDPKSLTALLVPTVDGNDVIFAPTIAGALKGDDDDDSNIYNFSVVCPPTCSIDGLG